MHAFHLCHHHYRPPFVFHLKVCFLLQVSASALASKSVSPACCMHPLVSVRELEALSESQSRFIADHSLSLDENTIRSKKRMSFIERVDWAIKSHFIASQLILFLGLFFECAQPLLMLQLSREVFFKVGKGVTCFQLVYLTAEVVL